MKAVLVAERDPHAVVRVLRAVGARVVVVAQSRDAADDALARQREWAAIAVGMSLPGEQRRLRSLIEEVAITRPSVPRAIVCTRPTRPIARLAAMTGATLLWKPLESAAIERLLARTERAESAGDRTDRAVRTIIRSRWPRLTERHLEIVFELARGQSREAICARLGIREKTLKSHVRTILLRTGAHDMNSLVGDVLRDALALLAAEEPPR